MAPNRYYTSHDISRANARVLEWGDFLLHLHNIPQFDSSLTYRLENISFNNMAPLCTNVIKDRLHNANVLIGHYEVIGQPPFVPLVLNYGDMQQVIFPPITHSDPTKPDAVVMDGSHRLFAAYTRGIPSAVVLNIIGPIGELPGDPVHWSDIVISNSAQHYSTRFRNFRPEGLRLPFTKTLNEEWLWKALDRP